MNWVFLLGRDCGIYSGIIKENLMATAQRLVFPQAISCVIAQKFLGEAMSRCNQLQAGSFRYENRHGSKSCSMRQVHFFDL